LRSTLEEKRPFIGPRTSESDLASWQCSTICCESDMSGPYLYVRLGNSPMRRIARTCRSPITTYSGHCSFIWLIHISWNLKRYEDALMTLSFRSRWASIVKEFASYPNDSKRLLMQTWNSSLINIFCLFLNKDWIVEKSTELFCTPNNYRILLVLGVFLQY